MSFIGNQPISAAFLTDTFNGNGTTTAFTLSAAPAGSSSILVAISGVVQAPATYGVVGTTLNFSAAPPVGTASIIVRYLGIPASGVTTTAYRTLTEFTATASQTTFTPPSYTVGFLNVYRNGVMLGSTDYTATNGTTVVLAVGALVGDLVTTESFYVSSVLNALPVTGGTISGNLVVTGTTSINNPHTMQVFTSGSGTYTKPAGCVAIKVRCVGGGGGGEGSGTGGGVGAATAGGTTTFGTSLLTATGAALFSGNLGGIGGTGTVSSPASGFGVSGQSGVGAAYTGAYQPGFAGGDNPLGQGGQGGYSSAGQAARGYGGGGATGGSAATALYNGNSGGAGGYLEAIIAAPSGTYSYSVGAAGAGGGAGLSGYAGGAGSAGIVIVEEYYV